MNIYLNSIYIHDVGASQINYNSGSARSRAGVDIGLGELLGLPGLALRANPHSIEYRAGEMLSTADYIVVAGYR